ncbi:hypothetical protein [Oerskovia jenensis]|uniref:hypothetical protein n=1 Tax=Oerskovia jenensis TaxID=162169 RepID=UPI0036D8D79F
MARRSELHPLKLPRERRPIPVWGWVLIGFGGLVFVVGISLFVWVFLQIVEVTTGGS